MLSHPTIFCRLSISLFDVERAGERVYQNSLADGQGRLQVHGGEGCLRLYTEESEAGTSDCYEDFAHRRSSTRNQYCCLTLNGRLNNVFEGKPGKKFGNKPELWGGDG